MAFFIDSSRGKGSRLSFVGLRFPVASYAQKNPVVRIFYSRKLQN
jgi:hypothetical protein